MYILTGIKKLFSSPAFWAAVLGTAMICMFSEIYYDTQSQSVKTVIEVYLQYTRNALLGNTELCSYSVFTKGFGSWIAMFVPVIVSISSIGILIDEKKSGMWRFSLHRVGRIRYSISGCLFVLLAGGLTLVLGYGLFGILSAIMFPSLSEYPAQTAAQFSEMTFRQGSAMSGIYSMGGFPLCIAVQLAQTFFYGAVCSAAAMLLSAVSENKYVIICTPFFLKYALGQLSLALGYKAAENPMNFNEELSKFANIIHPDAANSFLYSAENALGIIILNLSFLSVSAALYCILRVWRLKNET